jgi:hypothetical protein
MAHTVMLVAGTGVWVADTWSSNGIVREMQVENNTGPLSLSWQSAQEKNKRTLVDRLQEAAP